MQLVAVCRLDVPASLTGHVFTELSPSRRRLAIAEGHGHLSVASLPRDAGNGMLRISDELEAGSHECFAWVCHDDGECRGNGEHALFEEVLLAVGRQGLIVCGFRASPPSARQHAEVPAHIEASPQDGCLHLSFLEAQQSAHPAQCVSFQSPPSSPDYERLLSLVSEHPQESLCDDSWQLAQVHAGPSSSLVAFIVAAAQDEGNKSVPVGSYALVARLHAWGLQWQKTALQLQPWGAAARNQASTKGATGGPAWTSFAVAGVHLLAILASGQVHIWQAMTGSRVGYIDLPTYCQVPRSHFSVLAVTADCSTLAASAHGGLVCSVSTQDYFFHHPEHLVHLEGKRSELKPQGQAIHGGPTRWTSVAGSLATPLPAAPRHPEWMQPHDTLSTASASEGGPLKRPYRPAKSVGPSVFGQRGSAPRRVIEQLQPEPSPHPQQHLQRRVMLSPQPCGAALALALTPCVGIHEAGIAAIHSQANGNLLLTWQGLAPGAAARQSAIPSGAVAVCSAQGRLHLLVRTTIYALVPPQLPAPAKGLPALARALNLQMGPAGSRRSQVTGTPETQWQLAMLERACISDGPDQALHLCDMNRWSQPALQLRRLEVALELAQGLPTVESAVASLQQEQAGPEAAVAALGRLLFAALACAVGRSEASRTRGSRLLNIAARFATAVVRRQVGAARQVCRTRPGPKSRPRQKPSGSGWLADVAHHLESIRAVEAQLRRQPADSAAERAHKAPQRALAEDSTALVAAPGPEQGSFLEGAPRLPLLQQGPVGVARERGVLPLPAGTQVAVPGRGRRARGSGESAGEMLARWRRERCSPAAVVKDGLRTGRMALAVVHLQRQRGPRGGAGSHQGVFEELRAIGRGIVYELLCKGRSELAVEALRRLGEDVGAALRELALGTLQPSLRLQAAHQRQRLSRLPPAEGEALRTLASLEELYPSSSFLATYQERAGALPAGMPAVGFGDWRVECGEVAGMVGPSWGPAAVPSGSSPGSTEKQPGGAYLCLAARWLQAWDAATLHRVYLEQNPSWPHASHAAQMAFHVAHHAWPQIARLLDAVPQSASATADLLCPLEAAGQPALVPAPGEELAGGDSPSEKLTVVLLRAVPLVTLPEDALCSAVLQRRMERRLARHLMFVEREWASPGHLVAVLARAGMVLGSASGPAHRAEVQALVVHHCCQQGLPHTLQLFLDHHGLGLAAYDSPEVAALLAAVGNCAWAQWLVALRARGGLYRAALANACTTMGLAGGAGSVQAMVEPRAELTALASLVHAPLPPQRCLLPPLRWRSWHCSLESLRDALQWRFPTLWRALLQAVAPQTAAPQQQMSPTAAGGSLRPGAAALAKYLEWRGSLFSSASGDASLLLMLATAQPRALRTLLRVSIQGVPGSPARPNGVSSSDAAVAVAVAEAKAGESAARATELGLAQAQVKAWEAAVPEAVQKDLYAHPPEDAPPGSARSVEHFVRRARPLAALDAFLEQRLQQLPGPSASPQAAAQALLAPLTAAEHKQLLATVMPLGLSHFPSLRVVAACVALLELCGVASLPLRVTVAALRFIAEHSRAQPRASAAPCRGAGPLAHALAAHYARGAEEPSSEAPLALLRCLEQAVLPGAAPAPGPAEGGPSAGASAGAGAWLRGAAGDGSRLRAAQHALSQRWALVSAFCQAHHLPQSEAYLRLLAQDNDWVGFLAEAQAEGHSSTALAALAAREFTDAAVRSHVLTVLRSLEAQQDTAPPPSPEAPHNELFAILAECEGRPEAGQRLLERAQEQRWPLLALLASCFPGASALDCLHGWLDITAARVTAAVRGADAAQRAAAAVGRAVEALNRRHLDSPLEQASLPPASVSSEPCPFREAKRRRRSGSAEFSGSSSRTSTPPLAAGAQEEGLHRRQESVAALVGLLCRQQCFRPLLRAFELFTPAAPLLPFIRFLKAFSQMRLREAAEHLQRFCGQPRAEWMSAAAVAAAEAQLRHSRTAHEQRALLRLLASVDFGNSSPAAASFQRRHLALQLQEAVQVEEGAIAPEAEAEAGDQALLEGLLQARQWEDARTWAAQLDGEAGLGGRTSALAYVTLCQADALVAECKELLWEDPEERQALWRHCQALFASRGLPLRQAADFFLRHAEALEAEGAPARERHPVQLLALQSRAEGGPRRAGEHGQREEEEAEEEEEEEEEEELEQRVWLLAAEADGQAAAEGKGEGAEGAASCVAQTRAALLPRRPRPAAPAEEPPTGAGAAPRGALRRRFRLSLRPSPAVGPDRGGLEAAAPAPARGPRAVSEEPQPGAEERAVQLLLEEGELRPARQLAARLPHPPPELLLVEAAQAVAQAPAVPSALLEQLHGAGQLREQEAAGGSPLQLVEALAMACREGSGRGHCRRLAAQLRAAQFLGLPPSGQAPLRLLQGLVERGQEALPAAYALLAAAPLPPAAIAHILAEAYLKGLEAAHRGGHLEAPDAEDALLAPLLWRSRDFAMWARLCPHEPTLGHALMGLLVHSQLPPLCQVEVMLQAQRLYQASGCLDGLDVLLHTAARLGEEYAAAGHAEAAVRLLRGLCDLQALRPAVERLLEGGHLGRLLGGLREAAPSGHLLELRLALLGALWRTRAHDQEALQRAHRELGLRHETALSVEGQAHATVAAWRGWLGSRHPGSEEEPGTELLLEALRLFCEGAAAWADAEGGRGAARCVAQASLLALQVRLPDTMWVGLSETAARGLMEQQQRFAEALAVAQAYGLAGLEDWTPVLWAQLLQPRHLPDFLHDFVSTLPLPGKELLELAQLYRAEVAARPEYARYLGGSFHALLRGVRNVEVRLQVATVARDFPDVVDSCLRLLDRVPDTAGPLLLRRAHGGGYMPLM